MKAFAYVNATSEKDALAALSAGHGRAVPIAGGQDLLALMKDYVYRPERVVNVKGLPSAIAVPGLARISHSPTSRDDGREIWKRSEAG